MLTSHEDNEDAEEGALAPEIEDQGIEPMEVSVPAEPSALQIPNATKHALLRILIEKPAGSSIGATITRP